MSELPMLTFDNAPPELRAAFNFSTNAPPPPATSTPPSPPPPPAQAGNLPRVVQLALAQVGKAYVWGAAGPNSFDCSGLMLWCYKQLGVNLAHKASMQYSALRPVDRSQLQPGDLLYFQNIGGECGVCHVGMYAGDLHGDGKGAMVHAPQPGQTICVVPDVFGSRFWSKYFAGVRRP